MSEQFSCQCCGHCCEGAGGIVVGQEDLARLCGHLALSPEALEAQYGERRGGKLHIRAGEDGQCIFFVAGKGCAVHTAKPNICRAWPYFRGNLVDGTSLALAKEFCPGIPRALTLESFREQGLEYLQRRGLVADSTATEARALCVQDLLAEHKNNR